MRSAVCLVLLFWGCAPRLEPREGKAVPADMPQAQEQCRAQPELDWCHGH